MSTKIAVSGSGIITRTLATRFAQAGHVVTFGARQPGHAELAAFAAGIGDNFTALWFTLAFERGLGRNLGFKLLTR